MVRPARRTAGCGIIRPVRATGSNTGPPSSRFSVTPTTPVSGPDTAPAPRARHRILLFLVFLNALVVGLAGVLVITGAGLAVWDARYEARVLPGVHVGTVDLSGQDQAGAEAALATAYPFDRGSVVLRTPAGDTTIPYSAFGRRPDTTAMATAALLAGRNGDLPTRILGEVRLAMEGATPAGPDDPGRGCPRRRHRVGRRTAGHRAGRRDRPDGTGRSSHHAVHNRPRSRSRPGDRGRACRRAPDGRSCRGRHPGRRGRRPPERRRCRRPGRDRPC